METAMILRALLSKTFARVGQPATASTRADVSSEDVSSEFFVHRTSPDMVVHHVTGAFVAILKSQRVQAVIAATGMSSGVGSIFAGALLVVIPALVALAAFGPAPRSRDTPKVILVTGASSGLGKLMLDELRKAFPASVVYGTSRSGWSAKGTRVTEGDSPLGVTEEDGTQPLLALDVTDEDSVKRCVDAIVARHGELSVLVKNAGAVLQTWAVATTAADAEAQMATNFHGVVRMVRHCVPAMVGTVRRVVTIGSIGGRIGLPYNSMYSASKAATMVYTDALRMEVAANGVKVSLVEPGDLKPGMVNAAKAEGFDANVHAKGAFDIMRAEEAAGTDPAVVARTVARCVRSLHPRGRYLVGPDAWLVEVLTRLCSYPLREYFLASHYRIPPRHNAWIRV